MASVRVGTAEAATAEAGLVRPVGLPVTGAAAGLLAGGAMAGFLILVAAAVGLDPLHPIRVIGATFGGPEASLAGAATVAWGAFVHAAASIAIGLAFVAIFSPEARPLGGAVLGGGYALFVLGIMAAGVVPRVNDVFRVEMQPMGGSWVVAHALYGCVLGLAVAGLARRGRAGTGGGRNEPA